MNSDDFAGIVAGIALTMGSKKFDSRSLRKEIKLVTGRSISKEIISKQLRRLTRCEMLSEIEPGEYIVPPEE